MQYIDNKNTMPGEDQLSLIDITDVVRNFPPTTTRLVDRNHVVETMALIPSTDAPIVFLEGESGCGATTLLAHFCKRYCDQVFCLFIKPASKFSYSEDYLRLILAEQFTWYLNGSNLDKDAIDISEFESLLLKVRRKIRKKHFYIIVDGLHQLPLEDNRHIGQIFGNVLPIGVDVFRFIISGNQKLFEPHLNETKSKTFQVLRFSRPESAMLLGDVITNASDHLSIDRICKGNPGRLASVKRLLESGVTLQQILQSDPSQYLEFIDLEFSGLNNLTPDLKLVIAVITYSRHQVLIDELKLTANITYDDVEKALAACRFLVLTHNNSQIEFVSEEHRKFSETKLSAYKKQAITMQVNYLRDHATSSTALKILPNYYKQLDQTQAIIDLLSPHHFTELLKTTQSTSSLRARALLGIQSAAELKQATTIFQFALQRSIFCSTGNLEGMQSEVSALVSLGQPQRALALASQAPTKIGRLRLMAAYCRKVREKGSELDQATIDHLKELARQIDHTEIDEDITDLAEDILYIDPDTAFSFIEAAGSTRHDNNFKNETYARLTMATYTDSYGRTSDPLSELTRSRISDEQLQKRLESVRALLDISVVEILKTAESMPAKRKIYFLRNAILAGQRNSEILQVVEYALDQLIRHTDYIPKARDLADIARPLHLGVVDFLRTKKIIKRIESQLGLIEKQSGTKDLTLLNMRLAQAEMLMDSDSARNRITETYFDVIAVGPSEGQADSYAVMLRALTQLDKDGELERRDGFRAAIEGDLMKCLEYLLEGTADHFVIVQAALHTLAQFNSTYALKIAAMLNTEERRDEAYQEIAKTIVSGVFTTSSEVALGDAIGSIKDSFLYDKALAEIFSSVKNSESRSEWLLSLSGALENVLSPKQRCQCIIQILTYPPVTFLADKIEYFQSEFYAHVKNVESLVDRVNLTFQLAGALAVSNPEEANKLYVAALDLKDESCLHSSASIELVGICLRLLLRCFRSLAKNEQLSEDYVARFSRLVDIIPCTKTRAAIFGDLVTQVWCEGKSTLANELVLKHCRPLIETVEAGSEFEYLSIISECFPALYCGHKGSALALLEKVSPEGKGYALSRTVGMILTKRSPYEPSAGDKEYGLIRHEDVLDVFDLIRLAPTDYDLYSMVTELILAITARQSKRSITGAQKEDIHLKLLALLPGKLPDTKNILHQGFVISCTAWIWRLSEHPFPEWNRLVSEAKVIPNIADAVFVLLDIAESLPIKFQTLRTSLLHDCQDLIKKIPALVDRHSRLRRFCDVTKAFAPNLAKESLRDAWLITLSVDDRVIASDLRRKVIDLAEGLDPGFADQLIEAIDDDPARFEARDELKRSQKIQVLKREMIDNTESVTQKDLGEGTLPAAAWKNFKAMIAGRLEHRSPEALTKFIQAASSFDLQDAYPVLLWYIENSARRFTTRVDIDARIVPICEVLLVSTELAVSVLDYAVSNKRRILPSGKSEQSSGMVVKPGDRSVALDYLRSWLRQHGTLSLVLCDPYFSAQDVEFLRLVIAEAPDSKVVVLTKKNDKLSAEQCLIEWNKIVEQDPPETEVISVSISGDSKTLLHDRWLLTGNHGLRLGTSFNSLGIGKLSEISELTPARVSEVRDELSHFLAKERVFAGSRMSYSAFTI